MLLILQGVFGCSVKKDADSVYTDIKLFDILVEAEKVKTPGGVERGGAAREETGCSMLDA